MNTSEAVLWALLGCGVAEAAYVYGAMKPSGPEGEWTWPWPRKETPKWGAAVTCRFFLTGAAIAPLAASKRIPDNLMAFLFGLAAPVLVAKMSAWAEKNMGGYLKDSGENLREAPLDDGFDTVSSHTETATESNNREIPEPRSPKRKSTKKSDGRPSGSTGVKNARR
ncbi:hypothetical protein ABZ372_07460 [Streptomyces sp. NPDC005921]|uniref:hypothetical protein n=1 Tax=Streptomyces sp. NPDC005827 TaxID=3157070 RepID=UPI0033E32DAB